MRLREVSEEFRAHLEGIRVAALLLVSAFRCLVIWESPKTYPKQVTSRFARYDAINFTLPILLPPRQSTLLQAVSIQHGAWRIWLVTKSRFPRRRVIPFERWRLSWTRQRTRRIKRAYEYPNTRRGRQSACGAL